MTTIKNEPIGLAGIAAISTAEEGRAVALALYNQLQVKNSLIDSLVNELEFALDWGQFDGSFGERVEKSGRELISQVKGRPI